MFETKPPAENSEKSYDEKKRIFFFRFIRKYPEAVRLYEEYGLLPKKEGWANVAHYCAVEAAAADTLADLLKMSDEDRQAVTQAAFLHDFYKRKSIELIRSNPDNATAADEQSQSEAKEILEERNVDSRIISILDRSLGYETLEEGKVEQLDLSEKVIHYIDDVTSGDNFVSLKERMAVLKTRYPEIDKEGFDRYGRSTYDQQYKTGAEVERFLAEKIGLEQAEELPNVIKQKINEKINKI
jgi:hypothetical protein